MAALLQVISPRTAKKVPLWTPVHFIPVSRSHPHGYTVLNHFRCYANPVPSLKHLYSIYLMYLGTKENFLCVLLMHFTAQQFMVQRKLRGFWQTHTKKKTKKTKTENKCQETDGGIQWIVLHSLCEVIGIDISRVPVWLKSVPAWIKVFIHKAQQ